MFSPRVLLATSKYTIWHLIRPFHNSDAWPMTVLSGPAKGTSLVLDLRKNGAYWLGTYDRWILDRIALRDWIPIGGVAWDCGSYVGYYAALFRRIVGNHGNVVAFEGSRFNYERLRQVPALNQWGNVQVMHLAVGPDHSDLEFAGELGGSSGPLGLTKRYDGSPARERVRCAGVDELCFERGLPQPDFIKFDLESAEEFALHNGAHIFGEKRPVVLLEWHGDKVLSAVGRFLAEYGYLAWDILQFDCPEAQPLVDLPTLYAATVNMSNTLVCLPQEQSEKRKRVVVKAATISA